MALFTTIAIIGGAGAAGYVALKQSDKKSMTDEKPVTRQPPADGGARAPIQTRAALASAYYATASADLARHSGSGENTQLVNRSESTSVQDVYTASSNQYIDQAAYRAQKALEERLKKEIESLDSAARQEATKQLNERLGTNLPPDADWDDIKAALYAQGGSALASGLCGTGGGPAAAQYCEAWGAAVGAYAGEKIEDWAKDAWDSIEDWGSNAWDDLVDIVTFW